MMDKYYSNLLKVLLDTDDIDSEQLENVEKLYRFKRNDLILLPRVKEIIGILRSLQYDIQSVVDFGSRRGALLFPLLDNFPALQFIGVDIDTEVYKTLEPLSKDNQYFQFKMIKGDITQPINEIADKSIDVVIASEILEHLTEPFKAILEAVRIATKYIIITVPAKPDDNPQHTQYFRIDDMLQLLEKAGLKSVKVHPNANYNLFMISIN